jgi:formate hydrogenlyase transcriptional activator
MNESEINLQTELEGRLRFETLLADLSSRFINLPADQVDDNIEGAQRRICECLGLDLSTLWQWSDGASRFFTLTHLYRPLGGPPVPERLDAQEVFPWNLAKLQAGQVIVISSVEKLPPEAARDQETYRHYGVRSNLSFPLSAGGGPLIGTLSFNTMREEHPWPDTLVKRLQLVAQIFTNALARKRSDLALRESEARLSLAADSAGAGLWSLDPATGIFWVSDRARQMFEFPADRPFTLAGMLEVVHPEDRERIQEVVQQTLGSGETTRVDYRVVLPGGTVRWLSSRGHAQPAPAGKGERLMGVTLDITERKRDEEALLRSLAEIKELKDRLQAESDYLKAEIKVTESHGEIVGQGQAIKQVLHQVEQVAPTDSTVLISGETGTGKELIAQAIHRLSPRKHQLMVMVNCAALPGALVESELFGREKGAFTGALMRQAGRFELADRSTIFLDEVGELSPEVQAKLLRVLQSGEFERLGSSRTLQVNVRLIAATNRDLAQDVRKGRFREDLYYRLNVFPIRVPPLRERTEDIPMLVWAFVREFSTRMGKTITKVPRKTMEAFQAYPWPGNIRELRNVIERGVIVTAGDALKVAAPAESAQTTPVPMTLAESEREHILAVLERTNWRIKGPNGAARKLDLNPSTLYTRMEKLGIPTRRAKEQAQ